MAALTDHIAGNEYQSKFPLQAGGIDTPMKVAASKQIFEGAIVGVDGSGDAIPALTTAKVAGVALQKGGYDNSAVGTVTDEPEVVVYTGFVMRIATSASIKIGDPVYAANDNPADITTTANTAKFGVCVGIPETDVVDILVWPYDIPDAP